MSKKIISFSAFIFIFFLFFTSIYFYFGEAVVLAVEDDDRTLCAHAECFETTCALTRGLAKDECFSNKDCGGEGGGFKFEGPQPREYYETGWYPPIKITYNDTIRGTRNLSLRRNIDFSDVGSEEGLFLNLLVRKVLAAIPFPIEIPLPSTELVQNYEYTPHYECQNEKCVLVNSCGIDQCSSDTECRIPRKKVCSNLRCITTEGTGDNECEVDSNCGVKYSCNRDSYICYEDISGSYVKIEECEADCGPFFVSLEAFPTQILKGEKTKLTYSSSNGSTTNDCIATSTDNVWEKEVTPDNEGNTSGSDEVILNEEKTYNFSYTCYDKNNKSNTATAQVVVGKCPEGEESPHQECQDGRCTPVYSCGTDTCKENIDCETSPTPSVCSVTLEADPKTIFLGKTLDLKWSPKGAEKCWADTFLLKDNRKITLEDKSQGGGWYGLLLSPANEQLYKNTDINFDSKPSLNSPHTSTLKPTARGNYVYTISCDCTAEEEAEVETEITIEEEVEVKVIPVPYWREIIPVLPGFLRGLFNH